MIGLHMSALLARAGRIWCRWMHDQSTWPMHGVYQCRICFRIHEVPWANGRARRLPDSCAALVGRGQERVPSPGAP